jgi:antitoxin HicB
MRQYTVILEWDPEAEAYSAVVPALPGCASQGRTVDEALSNAQEAIELYLEELRARGEAIPEDVQTHTVQVAA